ncbi:MAG: hypothetical protein D6809_06930 [Gammaproteobacteria bacterium]|nr:MAG: hypothetical protein D6809_06930 [Gammaproteobacteria bacterium]
MSPGAAWGGKKEEARAWPRSGGQGSTGGTGRGAGPIQGTQPAGPMGATGTRGLPRARPTGGTCTAVATGEATGATGTMEATTMPP